MVASKLIYSQHWPEDCYKSMHAWKINISFAKKTIYCSCTLQSNTYLNNNNNTFLQMNALLVAKYNDCWTLDFKNDTKTWIDNEPFFYKCSSCCEM